MAIDLDALPPSIRARVEPGVIERARYRAAWPLVIHLHRSGIVDDASAEIFMAYVETGISAIDGLESWLLAEVGERGLDWDVDGTERLLGLRDADAAFWWRMRWA